MLKFFFQTSDIFVPSLVRQYIKKQFNLKDILILNFKLASELKLFIFLELLRTVHDWMITGFRIHKQTIATVAPCCTEKIFSCSASWSKKGDCSIQISNFLLWWFAHFQYSQTHTGIQLALQGPYNHTQKQVIISWQNVNRIVN